MHRSKVLGAKRAGFLLKNHSKTQQTGVQLIKAASLSWSLPEFYAAGQMYHESREGEGGASEGGRGVTRRGRSWCGRQIGGIGQGRFTSGRAGQGRAGQGQRARALTSSSQTCQQSSTIRSNPKSSKQLGRVKNVNSPLTASMHSPACHAQPSAFSYRVTESACMDMSVLAH